MTRFILAAGVAALAMTAPVAADPGKGNKGQGQGQAAKVDRGGGGNAKAQVRTERRQEMRVARSDQGKGRNEIRMDRRGDRDNVRVAKVKVDRIERRDLRSASRSDKREFRNANRVDKRELKQFDRNDRREVKAANRILRDRDLVRINNDGNWSNPGIGCPPGLAKQNAWCMPPGQLKKHSENLAGRMLPAAYANSLLPLGLRDYYQDDDDYFYRYGDGYVYRVDRDTNLIASLLPLIGGGLGLGQMFPTSYMNSYVPDYYQSFYPDSQDDYYRYANGYVYEIDRDSGMIEGIIPQLGYGYGMGQMLPPSYSYYNVPQQYRSFYPENDDYYYRYAPGAIYQVDRQSNLITSIASLLAGDLSVGQPLPMAYNAYNVPLGYRDQYYDTADNWYRYNDGAIYQVDPTTRLITAVISALI